MILFWIVVGFLAILIELLTPSALVSIWFFGGSLCAALCAFFHLSTLIQSLVFLLVSAVLIFGLRPLATKHLNPKIVPTNADRLIGLTALVTKTIEENQWGEVNINGSIWSAVSEDRQIIPIGTNVQILAIEGAKLIVKEI